MHHGIAEIYRFMSRTFRVILKQSLLDIYWRETIVEIWLFSKKWHVYVEKKVKFMVSKVWANFNLLSRKKVNFKTSFGLSQIDTWHT